MSPVHEQRARAVIRGELLRGRKPLEINTTHGYPMPLIYSVEAELEREQLHTQELAEETPGQSLNVRVTGVPVPLVPLLPGHLPAEQGIYDLLNRPNVDRLYLPGRCGTFSTVSEGWDRAATHVRHKCRKEDCLHCRDGRWFGYFVPVLVIEDGMLSRGVPKWIGLVTKPQRDSMTRKARRRNVYYIYNTPKDGGKTIFLANWDLNPRGKRLLQEEDRSLNIFYKEVMGRPGRYGMSEEWRWRKNPSFGSLLVSGSTDHVVSVMDKAATAGLVSAEDPKYYRKPGVTPEDLREWIDQEESR